ncbi:MAG: hypothetical protein WEB59_06240 [Thermoanaerobaculia bacterium]
MTYLGVAFRATNQRLPASVWGGQHPEKPCLSPAALPDLNEALGREKLGFEPYGSQGKHIRLDVALPSQVDGTPVVVDAPEKVAGETGSGLDVDPQGPAESAAVAPLALAGRTIRVAIRRKIPVETGRLLPDLCWFSSTGNKVCPAVGADLYLI